MSFQSTNICFRLSSVNTLKSLIFVLLFSTIAFNNEIYKAWEDLFSFGGNLIQVKNISEIYENKKPFSFNDISKNMYENKALLIGYIEEENIVHINPNKKSVERQWSESEKLIYIINRN